MRTRTSDARADATKRFFAEDVSTLTDQLVTLDRQTDPYAPPRYDDTYEQLNEALAVSRAACQRIESAIGHDGELLRNVQSRFQEIISPWFDRSWFMHRAKTKPQGYPGDYKILAAIYDGRAKSRGIGGYLDLYFLNTALGRAVAARLHAARDFLAEELRRRRGEVSVLNVACGPCREYAGGLEQPDGCHVRLTCIDYDREALEYVGARVTAVSTGFSDIRFTRYNALRMGSAKANVRLFGKSDIIYSIGLCDYIPDKSLVPMLRGWRESLNDDGVLYVAFKDGRRYETADYHWLVDWHFLQRTEAECRGLFEQAGCNMSRLQMTRGQTGVIMNFVSWAAPDKVHRVDAPERVNGNGAYSAAVRPSRRTSPR